MTGVRGQVLFFALFRNCPPTKGDTWNFIKEKRVLVYVKRKKAMIEELTSLPTDLSSPCTGPGRGFLP
jgi:hypothetical protein